MAFGSAHCLQDQFMKGNMMTRLFHAGWKIFPILNNLGVRLDLPPSQLEIFRLAGQWVGVLWNSMAFQFFIKNSIYSFNLTIKDPPNTSHETWSLSVHIYKAYSN